MGLKPMTLGYRYNALSTELSSHMEIVYILNNKTDLQVLYTSLTLAKSLMSAKRTVVFTTATKN